MRKTVQVGLVIWALVSFMTCSSPGQAIRLARVQANSPNTPVSSLTITASPSSVSFSLVSNGVAPGSPALSITTSWGGNCGGCTVNLWAYFSSASSAMSSGSSQIPSSDVLGEMTTGLPATYTAFTQTGPFGGAGASLELFQQPLTGPPWGGSRTDGLSLEVNLTNQNVAAGTYSGTLYIQAQSF